MKRYKFYLFPIVILLFPQVAVASDPTPLIFFYGLIALMPFIVLGPIFALIGFQFVPDNSEKELTHPIVLTAVGAAYILSFILVIQI